MLEHLSKNDFTINWLDLFIQMLWLLAPQPYDSIFKNFNKTIGYVL